MHITAHEIQKFDSLQPPTPSQLALTHMATVLAIPSLGTSQSCLNQVKGEVVWYHLYIARTNI